MPFRDLKPPRGSQTLFIMGTTEGWGGPQDFLYEIDIPKDEKGNRYKTPTGATKYLLRNRDDTSSDFADWSGILRFLDSKRVEITDSEYSSPSRKNKG